MSRTYIPESIRDEVKRRADCRCEYCGVPDYTALITYHIDHIIPEKQGGPTTSENLAYACQQCNIRKGDSIVAYSYEWRESIPLFHPREQEWNSQFILQNSGRIEARSKVGEATLRLLQINRLDRIARRKTLIKMSLI